MVSVGLLAGIFVMLNAQSSEPSDILPPDTTAVEQQSPDPDEDPIPEAVNSAMPSVVYVGINEGHGSGVVITPEGHIVTNYHVIEGAESMYVLFADERMYEAYTVGVAPSTDLAVIQIILNPGESVKAIKIGDSETLRVGEEVLAIGTPMRLQLRNTVTSGIVSATGRTDMDTDLVVEDFIQTDAAINPGNSGGALVNLRGELVGINTQNITNTGSNVGLGLAISVNLAMRVANDLIEFGELHRGYLGITSMDIPDMPVELSETLGIDTHGVFLSHVYDGIAADVAGLRSRDIILEIDGRTIDKFNQLHIGAFMKYPQANLEITYLRYGRVDSLQLTLQGKDHPDVASWLTDMGYPPSPIAVRYFDRWGLVIRAKSEGEYRESEGVIIQHVIRQQEIPYLQEGMLLERINGEPVRSVEQVIKELRKADEFARFYVRDQGERQRMVTLEVLKP